MKHLDELAEILKKEGVRHAFGVSGGGPSLHLIDALVKRGVSYHPAAHEAAAAMMAGACCRTGESSAVAIGIKGPGFANFFPGMVANHYENRPAILLTEYYPQHIPNSRKHKRLNHDAVGREIFKADGTCAPGAVGVSDLLAVARAEAPGPVLLQIAGEPDDSAVCVMPPEIMPNGHLETLLARVKKADKVALVLGSMVVRHLKPGIFDQLTIPVATTAAAKGAYDESGPFRAGVVTGEIKDLSPERAVLSHADLVVGIGLRNTEVVRAALGVPLVSLDMVGGTISGDYREGYEPLCEVVEPNIEKSVDALLEVLKDKAWGEDLVIARRKALGDHFGHAWAPPAAFALLQAAGKSRLVLDTGYFCTVGETVWQAHSASDFCGSSNGRFMGTAVPTAIGLAVAEPDVPVICVCGDGGIRPYLPELRLAVEEKLPILFVLMSDGQYGSIAAGGRAKGYTERAYSIKRNSWRTVIEAMGIPSREAHGLGDMGQGSLRPYEGPSYLELHFDPESYIHAAQALR